jgi:hypothetical protein
MDEERLIETASIDWEGFTVAIAYEADWLNIGAGGGRKMAHLTLQVTAPADGILPVTETGYRSHFLPFGIVEEAGGPSAFARAWLDDAAHDPRWRKQFAAWRQLSLL